MQSSNKFKNLTEDKNKESISGRLSDSSTAQKMTNSATAERLYKKMLDEVDDYAILLLDLQGIVLNWNPGILKIKGYHPEEIIGMDFRNFYSESDRSDMVPDQLLKLALQSGRATHEGWRIKKDGSRFWGSIVITTLHDDDGEALGFAKLTRDLTEKKEAEEQQMRYRQDLEAKHLELRQSEEKYHKMIAEVEDYAIILLDRDGTILNWNRGAQTIKGYAPEEIIGQNFTRFYLKRDVEDGLAHRLMQTAVTNGKASHEGWRLKKDGTSFWGSVVLTALHDEEGHVIGFSKVTRDLTERKIAEQQQERYTAELQRQNDLLRISEERYHRMIAEIQDYAIILLDIQGNILNWNKGAENIKGYSEAEILGKNFRQFYRPEDQDAGLPERLLGEAVKHNRSEHEGWRVRKDGTHFWGSIVITALHDDNGAITGFSKVTRDLTQKKHFEDRILTQNKQLEEYAYVASHDLQEPLRKITMFTGLLKDSIGDPASVHKYLEKIQNATSRMSKLIKAVLEYSQAIDIMGLRADVDLNEIVSEIESDFSILLAERNGRIIYPKLPVVYAIPIQMHQLVSNLINNALKFSEGSPEIIITSEAAGDNQVRLTFSDNGIGFDPQYTDKVFKMFHKLHDKGTGTGIGLALCKRIVEGHGGSISASSVPGKGSTFEIVLPLR